MMESGGEVSALCQQFKYWIERIKRRAPELPLAFRTTQLRLAFNGEYHPERLEHREQFIDPPDLATQSSGI
ncbi:hypothetical protein MJO28_012575 [Puccinia striiformis f. sp. tritici]|uniref:Uncharacterized protein n=1 Tax=Puccinia striiformis f. sp. tritici TaxID=168172 RepID=A0ACC0E0D8_9BASI|nr:hypothetical protein MJO28_012575 [Puccinia striiformis f. sp. tritici]